MSLENPTPKIYQENVQIDEQRRRQELDPNIADPIDQQEIFDIIRSLKDPEHPLTLEQLHIVAIPDIELQDNQVTIYFTPTIPHCSMALMIGLTISIQLNRCLPKRFKVKVQVKAGTHNQEIIINKQLSDKERMLAAMENTSIMNIIKRGIKGV